MIPALFSFSHFQYIYYRKNSSQSQQKKSQNAKIFFHLTKLFFLTIVLFLYQRGRAFDKQAPRTRVVHLIQEINLEKMKK